MKKVNLVFPSPLGELYFLIFIYYFVRWSDDLFPSPLGELYFLIEHRLVLLIVKRIGFRPLSGSYIS